MTELNPFRENFIKKGRKHTLKSIPLEKTLKTKKRKLGQI